MVEHDPHADTLVARMGELLTQAQSATRHGEFLRLSILLSEARDDFWKRSQQDFAAHNQMWSADFAPLERAIRRGIEHFEHDAAMPPIALDRDGPTVRNFFRHSESGGSSPTFEAAADRAALIAGAEQRLGIHLPALAHDLFVHTNGGYTDFLSWPLTSDPPYSFDRASGGGWKAFAQHWTDALPGEMLASVQHWISLETMMANITARNTEIGITQSDDWRTGLADPARLIVLSREERKGNGAYTYLCLDYRGSAQPAVVSLHELEPFGGALEELRRWPDFATLFHGLRRLAREEIDGLVRRRGQQVTEIYDQGQWRFAGE